MLQNNKAEKLGRWDIITGVAGERESSGRRGTSAGRGEAWAVLRLIVEWGRYGGEGERVRRETSVGGVRKKLL